MATRALKGACSGLVHSGDVLAEARASRPTYPSAQRMGCACMQSIRRPSPLGIVIQQLFSTPGGHIYSLFFCDVC